MANQEQKFFAILCYVFGLSILAPLLLYFVVDDPYVKKHAKQSLMIHLGVIIIFSLSTIGGAIISVIPLIKHLVGLIAFFGKLIYILGLLFIGFKIWSNGDFNLKIKR